MESNFLIKTKDNNFFPKFRNNLLPQDFQKWLTLYKFNVNKPFFLVFPDENKTSLHPKNVFQVDFKIMKGVDRLIKLNKKSQQLLIVSDKFEQYRAGGMASIPEKYDWLIHLFPKAATILSTSYDNYFWALWQSKNVKLLYPTEWQEKPYDLISHADDIFKSKANLISTFQANPTAEDIFGYLD